MEIVNQCIVFTVAGHNGYLVNCGGFLVSPPVILQCQGLSLVVIFIWWWPCSSWTQRFCTAASALDKLSAWIYGVWFPPSHVVTCGKCHYSALNRIWFTWEGQISHSEA